ncbi:sugar phosphate isomerase/epimerase [Succinatimonas hippei]|uniref:sugar phosphate isomerase/epimerase family protein n=1 Tax=Succinatimonas hippei TaxID=626938 RepID=UPI0026EB2D12|nr:sugar phosphate isomerase/epimerase [Succinatimonas hippei]
MSMYCYNEACTKDFLDLEKDVTLAKQAGFDLIELRFDCINKYLENHSISELKNLLDDTKIKPSALNALYIYPEFLSQKDIKEKHDFNINLLNLIEELYHIINIDKCIVVAPLLEDDSICKNYNQEEIKANCVRILKYLAQTKPYIKWIFEPVGLSRSLVQDANFACEIINEVKNDNVGLVLDSYNLYLKERSDCYSFEKINAKQIFAIHLMNGKKVSITEKIIDQRYRTFCEDGDAINLSNFLNALQAINYKGMISTEVFNPEYPKIFTQEQIINRAFKELSSTLTNYDRINNYSFF